MDRIYIGIFGRTNAGKSTLLNRLAGGEVAVVSPVAGTTTDAVRKNGEIMGLGAVTYIDTAGFDDASELGALRIEGTRAAMEQVDIALLVYREWGAPEEELMKELAGIPTILVQNSVRHSESPTGGVEPASEASRGISKRASRESVIRPFVSLRVNSAKDLEANPMRNRHCEPRSGEAIQKNGMLDCFAPDGTRNDVNAEDAEAIFAAIKAALPTREKPTMFGGSVKKGDRVVLVMPQDSEAPAGRLILPQVQAIRELLDIGAIAVAVQPAELEQALDPIPQLIVTDSQVIALVKRIVREHIAQRHCEPRSGEAIQKSDKMDCFVPDGTRNDAIEITSFSILLAAARGDRKLYEKGLLATDTLKDGDRILIAESCTHQSSCDDIGRVKIPRWLREYTGKRLEFDTVSGLAPLPKDLARYALAIQCGACMVSRRQLLNRLKRIDAAGVPVTNYGMLINKITQ